MTGRELVSASLRLLGVLAPGETLAAHEATDGLAALNRMLGSWSNEGLMIAARVREEFALVANTAVYTLGTGATFNSARPMFIEEAAIEDQSSTPTTEHPVDILTSSEWASITAKGETSSIPRYLYAEGTFPNETLNLYPVPTVANKLVLYSKKPLTEIATLDTAVSLPPGYDRALIYNFAIDVAPEYGKAVPDAVVMIATESKVAIKRTNQKPRYLRIDVPASSGGSFDITTGGR